MVLENNISWKSVLELAEYEWHNKINLEIREFWNVIFDVQKLLNEYLILNNTKSWSSPYSPYVKVDVENTQLTLVTWKEKVSWVDLKEISGFEILKNLLWVISNISDDDMRVEIHSCVKEIVSDVDKILNEQESASIEAGYKFPNIEFEEYPWNPSLLREREINNSIMKWLYNLMGSQRNKFFDERIENEKAYLELNDEGCASINRVLKEIWRQYKKKWIDDYSKIFPEWDHLFLESDNHNLDKHEILDLIKSFVRDKNATQDQREGQWLFMNRVGAIYYIFDKIDYMKAFFFYEHLSDNLDGFDEFDDIVIERRIKELISLSNKNLSGPWNTPDDLIWFRSILKKNYDSASNWSDQVINHMESIIIYIKNLIKKGGKKIKAIKIANKWEINKWWFLHGIYMKSPEEKQLFDRLDLHCDNVSMRKKKKTSDVGIKEINQFLQSEISNQDSEIYQNFLLSFVSSWKRWSNWNYKDIKMIIEVEWNQNDKLSKSFNANVERMTLNDKTDNYTNYWFHRNLERQKSQISHARQNREIKGNKILEMSVNAIKSRAIELCNYKQKVKLKEKIIHLKECLNQGYDGDIQAELLDLELKEIEEGKTWYTSSQIQKEDSLAFIWIEDINISDLAFVWSNKRRKEVIDEFSCSLINRDIQEWRLIRIASADELGLDNSTIVSEVDMTQFVPRAVWSKNVNYNDMRFVCNNYKNNLETWLFDNKAYVIVPHPQNPKKAIAMHASKLARIWQKLWSYL